MRKQMCGLLALLLLLTVCCAAAEETVAWTSELPLLTQDEAAWLVLANHEHPLTSADVPADLVTVTKRQNDGRGQSLNGGVAMATTLKVQLVRTVSAAVSKMFDDAERAGVELYLRLGYRSYKDQEKLWSRAKGSGDYLQAPGESDWQTGLAIGVVNYEWRGQVLNADFGQSAEAKWLAENAARFGFVLRYPKGKEDVTGNDYEPWHLRYVGSSKVAAYMVRNNLTLEEFTEQYDAAVAEFTNRGGSIEASLSAQDLPAGPVVLDTETEDGDYDIILFHD